MTNFARTEVIPEAEQFFATHEHGSAARAVKQVFEAIAINEAQLKRDGEAIARYLLSRN